MPNNNEVPRINQGGLVTVAYLKARLDEGDDHLGMFMPLVIEAINSLGNQSFTHIEIQENLATVHGVAMPLQTVQTLLKRAATKRLITRNIGRYRRNPNSTFPVLDVAREKASIAEGETLLGSSLQKFAAERGLMIDSVAAALESFQAFLEREQVALLLGNPPDRPDNAAHDGNAKDRMVIAAFLQSVLGPDVALTNVIRGMLEGMVLYRAAFLPDLNSASRRFRDLRVIFDSVLVRQALGYEGAAMAALMRETVNVLEGSGVQCIVLDKSLGEIRRILSMYEMKLGTALGRSSLKQVPMARHFLTQLYSPSDVREMSALLDQEVKAVGLHILHAPNHEKEFTGAEKALAKRLSDRIKKDELEPRVIHDVDCVAAVLTLRKGHHSPTVDDARVVFATTSPLVILNARLWWQEDQLGLGVEPVVHIRALANLAWLKKPSLCVDFKVRELIALCGAALRPSQATWEKFRKHLESLHKSNKVTSDEVTAVLVSAMSDQLLREAEFESDDPDDIDVTTLDEVVERVKSTYQADTAEKLQELSDKIVDLSERERRAKERADSAENTLAEQERRRSLSTERLARTLARCITQSLKWSVSVGVFVGGLALLLGRDFHSNQGGGQIFLGIAVILFVVLESLGILHHVSTWTSTMETYLTGRFRARFEARGAAKQKVEPRLGL